MGKYVYEFPYHLLPLSDISTIWYGGRYRKKKKKKTHTHTH